MQFVIYWNKRKWELHTGKSITFDKMCRCAEVGYKTELWVCSAKKILYITMFKNTLNGIEIKTVENGEVIHEEIVLGCSKEVVIEDDVGITNGDVIVLEYLDKNIVYK